MPAFTTRFVATVCTALMAANACSQPADAGSPVPAPRLATKEEYRACLDAQDRLEGQRTALTDAERMLQSQASRVQVADADLAAQLKKHQPSNQAERASYNRAVEVRNRHVDALNREARALQAAQDAFNRRVFDSNARCLGLMVSSEVADAVAAERVHHPKPPGTGASAEPASTPSGRAAAP